MHDLVYYSIIVILEGVVTWFRTDLGTKWLFEGSACEGVKVCHCSLQRVSNKMIMLTKIMLLLIMHRRKPFPGCKFSGRLICLCTWAS